MPGKDDVQVPPKVDLRVNQILFSAEGHTRQAQNHQPSLFKSKSPNKHHATSTSQKIPDRDEEGKNSKLTVTHLSNFMLVISIIKNIASKFSNPIDFEEFQYKETIKSLNRVEKILKFDEYLSMFQDTSVQATPEPSRDATSESINDTHTVKSLVK